MIPYVPRVGLIYVVALTASFQQVLTKEQARAIRGMKVHIRFKKGQAPPFFQLAFSASPSAGATTSGDGIYTVSGSGTGDMAAPSNGLWAKVRDSGDAGALMEILTWG